jgi:hypothetical protein
MSESFEEIKLRWMKSVDMHTTLDQYSLARFIHKELEKKLADANALINETQLYYMEQVKRVEDVQQRLINMYEKEKRDLEKKLVDARETLSFYADRSNWRYSGNDRFDNNICHKDSSKVKTGNTVDTVGGKHARECLRRLEEK